jgi:hypothetical protein
VAASLLPRDLDHNETVFSNTSVDRMRVRILALFERISFRMPFGCPPSHEFFAP